MSPTEDFGGLDPNEPDAAIRLGERASAERDASRWGLLLVVFMRAVAALWTFQGLVAWADLLTPARSVLETAPRAYAVLLVVFAIFDLVAAVGLWLATPWGGVLWLFAACVQIFAGMAMRSMFWGGWIVVDALLIAIYFTLTWQAGRINDTAPYRAPRASRVKQRLQSNGFTRSKV